MARFEVADGEAHEFWEITLAAKTITLRWGRIGSRGRSKIVHFASDAEARADYARRVDDKRAGGYVLVDGIEEPVAVEPVGVVVARSPELEAAVIENPDDEAALMVLGDWLQTQGDPRGELISLQHALKQAGGDPAQFLERKRAAETFYKQHEAGLLGPLFPLRHLFKLEWQLGYIRGARLSLHAAQAGDPDLAALLRTILATPAALALQELGFGATPRADYQDVIDALATAAPGSLRALAFGEVWPGLEDKRVTTLGAFAPLAGRFERLRKLVLGAPATFGAWTVPGLTHLEVRTELDPTTWGWITTRCRALELLVLDAVPDFVRLDTEGMPALRKLRVRYGHGAVESLAGTPVLRGLRGLELGELELGDAALLAELGAELAHLEIVRASVNVPITDEPELVRRIETTLRRLRTQTKVEVVVHKYHPG